MTGTVEATPEIGSGSRRLPWREGLVAVACTVAGLTTRLHGLGAKPFWLDEVTTLHRSALPFMAMVRDSLSFHHLPAYFLLSSMFLPFGHDEVALRLPAALFGGLSCGLAAIVAFSLAGVEAALLAGMLMAAAPIEVQYGQEARSYTLVICLVLVALWGLIGLVREPDRAALPLRDPRMMRGRWLAYAGGTVGGLMVLGVAISWLLVANLAVLVNARRSGMGGGFLRRWGVVQAGIVLLAAPGFVAMFLLVMQAHGTFKSGMDWIPPVSWHHLWTAFEALYMLRTSSLIADRLFDSPVPWLGPLVVALVVGGLAALRRDRAISRVLLVSVAALPLGTIALSLVQPMFMPRYVLWSTAPFLVLAGVGCGGVSAADALGGGGRGGGGFVREPGALLQDGNQTALGGRRDGGAVGDAAGRYPADRRSGGGGHDERVPGARAQADRGRGLDAERDGGVLRAVFGRHGLGAAGARGAGRP